MNIYELLDLLARKCFWNAPQILGSASTSDKTYRKIVSHLKAWDFVF